MITCLKLLKKTSTGDINDVFNRYFLICTKMKIITKLKLNVIKVQPKKTPILLKYTYQQPILYSDYTAQIKVIIITNTESYFITENSKSEKICYVQKLLYQKSNREHKGLAL